jgi:hypothetical protein
MIRKKVILRAVRCIGRGFIFIVAPHPEHEGAQDASSFADPSAQSLVLWQELTLTGWTVIQHTTAAKNKTKKINES